MKKAAGGDVSVKEDAKKVDEYSERTKSLTDEFNDLRTELEALAKKKDNKERSRRKSQLRARIHEITIEMTQMVSNAQQRAAEVKVTSSDDLSVDKEEVENFDQDDTDLDDFEDLNLAQSCPVEPPAATGRRYDSTTSEESGTNLKEIDHCSRTSSQELREDMKATAKFKDLNDNYTVMHVSAANRWAGLFGAKGKDQGRKRVESLRVEVEKLEKELEVLTLKEENEQRKEEIITRLQQLSDEMLDVGNSGDGGVHSVRLSTATSSATNSKRAKSFWRPHGSRSKPAAAAAEVDDLNFVPVDDEIGTKIDTSKGKEQPLHSEGGQGHPKTLRTFFEARRGHAEGHAYSTRNSSPSKEAYESVIANMEENKSNPLLPGRKKSRFARSRGSTPSSAVQDTRKGSNAGPVENLSSLGLPGRRKSRLATLGGVASKTFQFHRKKYENTSPVTPVDGKQIDTNRFEQVRHRIELRGEKLTTLGTQAEDMNNAVQEMAAVARKLRERQEKGLFT